METTEFKVGDVVRIKRCWLNGVNEGLELEVIRIGGACVFTKPHPQIVDDEPAFVPRDIELVRRAPASPAQEAPACVACGKPQTNPKHYFTTEDQRPLCACCNERGYSDLCKAIAARQSAPMPSGSAGKEEPYVKGMDMGTEPARAVEAIYDGRGNLIEMRDVTPEACQHKRIDHELERCADCGATAESLSTEQYLAQLRSLKKPDPYAQHRLAMEDSKIRDLVDMCKSTQAARKRNIAALARELDQPTAERRARVSRFDPTPWQDWPKGCERNEP